MDRVKIAEAVLTDARAGAARAASAAGRLVRHDPDLGRRLRPPCRQYLLRTTADRRDCSIAWPCHGSGGPHRDNVTDRYGVGLLFVVPLGDLVENRRLVLISVTLSAVALACAAFAPSAALFLTCAAVIGLGSVAVQVLIPLAAHLAPDATRGRVVGMVSSGLMIGIMLARPVSSFIAAQSSWRVVFGLSALATVILAATLSRSLPTRAPRTKMTYGELMAPWSIWSGGRRSCVGAPSTRAASSSPSACFGRRRPCCWLGRTMA